MAVDLAPLGRSMRSRSAVSAVLSNGCTVLDDLRCEPPLAIRPTAAAHGAAVALVGSAAAPVGGDELALDVRVGAGAALTVEAIAATMVWPGRNGERSTQRLQIAVESRASLVWKGQPVLPVLGCNHMQETEIELAADSTLDFTEEVALGRASEPPGRLDLRLRVTRASVLLLHHRQLFDAEGPGWLTSAVMADHRHVVQRLVVGSPLVERENLTSGDAAAAVLPLGDDACVVLATGVTRVAAVRLASKLRYAPAAAERR